MTSLTTSDVSRARYAVLATFILHGTLIGSWAPHIAFAKERLGLGAGWFGVALLALPIGAVVAMPIAGILVNRFGSGRLTLALGLIFFLAVLGPTHAPDLKTFMLTGVVFGAATGSMDVAMNAHGLSAERLLKRPIMSVLHGGFSLGCIIGAVVASGLIKLIGPEWQIIATALVLFAGLIAAAQFFLPPDVDKGLSGSHFAWPTAATFGLGALCFLALMIEGSILDWGAIFMRESHHVDPAAAALAFGFYQGGMALARFTGDYLRFRYGAVPLILTSALMTAAGTAVALLMPNALLSMVAFIFAGIGIGNLAPVLFAGGGRLEPDAPGRGIAAVSTMGYSGFLAGPPLIGFAAQGLGLPLGLGLTVIAALIIAVFARSVQAADKY